MPKNKNWSAPVRKPPDVGRNNTRWVSGRSWPAPRWGATSVSPGSSSTLLYMSHDECHPRWLSRGCRRRSSSLQQLTDIYYCWAQNRNINSFQCSKVHIFRHLCLHHLVMDKGRWWSVAGEVNVGLAMHWILHSKCCTQTDSIVLSERRLLAYARGIAAFYSLVYIDIAR